MENSKQPAYPTELIGTKGEYRKTQPERFAGLTKREYFAGLAMQAIIQASPKDIASNIGVPAAPNTIDAALLYADELLKQLEK